MHFSVTHSTAYHYSEPVHVEPHIFRLRPRSDGSQRLISFDLRITPEPAGQADLLDQDGNALVQTWFADPLRELHVESRFEVETLRENPYNFLLSPPERLALPAKYDQPLDSYLHGGFKTAGFAADLLKQSGAQTMPFLELLNRRIFTDWTQIVRLEGEAFDAAATLKSHEGSCRDLAVLFCEACRAVGLASRFVSGYEIASAGSGHPYMHAWSEVNIPGAGWRGFDPSRGVAVAADHVAVAASADPRLAAPVVGSYRGAAKSSMSVAIRMQVS